MQSFAKNPSEFIQTWLESQSRDLESVLGSGPSDGLTLRQEELRRSEFFRLPWVEEVSVGIRQVIDLLILVRPSQCRKGYVLPTIEEILVDNSNSSCISSIYTAIAPLSVHVLFERNYILYVPS